MRMARVMVQVPQDVKTQLDRLREQGIGTSWFIRRAVEQALKRAPAKGQKRAVDHARH